MGSDERVGISGVEVCKRVGQSAFLKYYEQGYLMEKQRYLPAAVSGECEFSVGVEVWNIFDAAPQRVPGPPRKKN